jgi:rare lipoprotein A
MERMERFIIIGMCFFCLTSFYEATYYGGSFHGNYTKSGEIFDKNKLTAASNKLPLGALIKVTNKDNGKSVVVKINDTGAMPNHVIDLSEKAFKKIADLKTGRIKVKVNIIKWK